VEYIIYPCTTNSQNNFYDIYMINEIFSVCTGKTLELFTFDEGNIELY